VQLSAELLPAGLYQQRARAPAAPPARAPARRSRACATSTGCTRRSRRCSRARSATGAAPAAELLLAAAAAPAETTPPPGGPWGERAAAVYKALVFLRCAFRGHALPPGAGGLPAGMAGLVRAQARAPGPPPPRLRGAAGPHGRLWPCSAAAGLGRAPAGAACGYPSDVMRMSLLLFFQCSGSGQ